MGKMRASNIIIGCEESFTIAGAFRRGGYKAFSCDTEPTRGNPDYHFQMDIFIVLKGGWLRTQSGKRVYIDKWDFGIFHPPCTFIANSSAKHLYKGMNKENGKNMKRWKEMKAGALFFKRLLEADIEMIAVENPVMLGYALAIIGQDPAQTFQPWQHGHMEVKRTCLWLKNLPPIKETKNVYNAMMKLPYAERAKVHHCAPGPNRAKIRSTTYPGFARAVVKQWGKLLTKI